jgi:hypothetical protein
VGKCGASLRSMWYWTIQLFFLLHQKEVYGPEYDARRFIDHQKVTCAGCQINT